MASFGRESNKQLDTCDWRLVKVARATIKIMDFSVLEGHRSLERQLELYSKGREKLPGGPMLWKVVDKDKIVTKIDGVTKLGMHNYEPAKAMCLAPYPIDWSNRTKAIARFYLLAGVVIAIAFTLGIKLRWGGDWDGDWDLFDQEFDDLGHFEIKED